MTLLDTAMQVVVTSSAAIAAVAAVGIYRRVHNLVDTVERHERTLYGVDDNDAWMGLVERVAAHEAELDDARDGGES